MTVLVEVIGVAACGMEGERHGMRELPDDGSADGQCRNRRNGRERQPLACAGGIKCDTPQSRAGPPYGDQQRQRGHRRDADPIDGKRHVHVRACVGDRHNCAAFLLDPDAYGACTHSFDIMAA